MSLPATARVLFVNLNEQIAMLIISGVRAVLYGFWGNARRAWPTVRPHHYPFRRFRLAFRAADALALARALARCASDMAS